ncbi:MAG: class I SAM-dependent methyltransferase [Cyanobacteria bacterium P01_C01_bin.89]
MSPASNSVAPDSAQQQTLAAVEGLYDTYPFPPEPLLDEPPPGYNWRWNWTTAYAFCSGRQPANKTPRILDAGCGTGVGTEYLLHLNPEANITAIDLSSGALDVARERCRRSGKPGDSDRLTFHHMSLYDANEIPGEFDLINCVGVLHHLPDPTRGIQALAKKLAPGGIMHVFVYGELGRWEIQLMQEAIALIRNCPSDGAPENPYEDGVKIGRDLFSTLPEHSALVRREKERWSMENTKDECFADMYVHPQEVDYNVNTLFNLIEASGLEFLGFSNPKIWTLNRLIDKAPHLIERAQQLPERDRYRLIEILDPGSISHYEFFLARPPFTVTDWSDNTTLLNAIPQINPCLDGWPGQAFFNPDYQIVKPNDLEFQFLQGCDANPGTTTVGQLIDSLHIPDSSNFDLSTVRQLLTQQLLILTPPV